MTDTRLLRSDPDFFVCSKLKLLQLHSLLQVHLLPKSALCDLEFGVLGFGFWVLGFGFGIWCLFGVWGVYPRPGFDLSLKPGFDYEEFRGLGSGVEGLGSGAFIVKDLGPSQDLNKKEDQDPNKRVGYRPSRGFG